MFAEEESRTHTLAELVDDLGWNRRRTKVLVEDGQALFEQATLQATEGFDLLLRQKSARAAGREIPALLADLSDAGFSWRDIARMVGVSVPALRKWRNGEAISGQNRRRLAHLVAVLEVLRDRFMHLQDPAGWLEAPVDAMSGVTGLDLLAGGREDLVFRYAGGDDPKELVEEFEPSWLASTDDVEIFVAGDGLPAIRPLVADG